NYCNQVQAPPTRLQLLLARSLNLCNTRVYGPSHEERSIFLQVPAMTGSVHPRNLEDPLLLQTIYIVYIILNFRVCVSISALESDRIRFVPVTRVSSSFVLLALRSVKSHTQKRYYECVSTGIDTGIQRCFFTHSIV
uniref:Uncharacterized protein n=1 Tax=Astatotilapia calliptera TaxID=8154 RepID=A0A3P8QJJ7_ASTCA